MGSPVEVSRTTFRIILVALLVISGAFAAWSWLRPYEWSADAKADCVITGAQLVHDHSYYWLNLQLVVSDGQQHDLQKPIRLVLSDGRKLQAADTTLEGNEQKNIHKIWLKFWLHERDLTGPLHLQVNEGTLSVRSGRGIPKLRPDGSRYFVTHRW